MQGQDMYMCISVVQVSKLDLDLKLEPNHTMLYSSQSPWELVARVNIRTRVTEMITRWGIPVTSRHYPGILGFTDMRAFMSLSPTYSDTNLFLFICVDKYTAAEHVKYDEDQWKIIVTDVSVIITG